MEAMGFEPTASPLRTSRPLGLVSARRSRAATRPPPAADEVALRLYWGHSARVFPTPDFTRADVVP